MKKFELIRIHDLESFYVIAEDEVEAIKLHIANKESVLEKKDRNRIIGMQEFENGFLFKHNDEVYWVKKQK